MSAPAAAGAAPAEARSAAASPWQQVQQLMRELPHLVSERVDLLALELERAGRAVVRIVILVVAAAVLLVTAWLAAWSLVFMVLVAVGVPSTLALLLVLLVNALAAWFALLRAQKLVHVVSLPATRRHLMVAPAKEPPPPSAVSSSTPVPSTQHAHDAQRPVSATRGV